MEFFKNISEKIGDTMNNGKRFIDDKTRDMKMNNEIKSLNAEKEKVFAALGKAYFEKYMLQEENEFKDLMEKIFAIDENIEEINKKKEAILANRCKYCGADLEPDANFCTKCGHKVEREEATVVPELDKEDNVVMQEESEEVE